MYTQYLEWIYKWIYSVDRSKFLKETNILAFISPQIYSVLELFKPQIWMQQDMSVDQFQPQEKISCAFWELCKTKNNQSPISSQKSFDFRDSLMKLSAMHKLYDFLIVWNGLKYRVYHPNNDLVCLSVPPEYFILTLWPGKTADFTRPQIKSTGNLLWKCWPFSSKYLHVTSISISICCLLRWTNIFHELIKWQIRDHSII